MALNSLQRSIVHGALALSALTGCSAVPRGINHGRAAVVEDANSPRNIEKQRKALRKRIIVALEGLFSNYDKLNKIESEMNADGKKRVIECSAKSGGEQTVSFREQMFEVVRPIQEALTKCAQLPREEKIECSADVVIATGKGEEYLEAVEGLSGIVNQNIGCLEATAPRKNRQK